MNVVHCLVKMLTCWQQQVESAGHTAELGLEASHDCVGAVSKGLVGLGSPWPYPTMATPWSRSSIP